MLLRPRRVVLATASVALVVFASWALWEWRHPGTTTAAKGNLAVVSFSAFALGCAATAGLRSSGTQRVAWLSLSAGLSGTVAGDLIKAFVDLAMNTKLPSPSPVDALYLMFPASMIAATVIAPLSGVRAGIRLALDGLIVSSSMFIIAWSVGLRDIYEASGHAAFTFAVYLSFPFADLVMLTMVMVVLFREPRGRRLSPSLLAAGLSVIASTNGILIYNDLRPYDNGVVVGWAVGMYLVGAAGLASAPSAPAAADDRRKPRRTSLWLPYLMVPFAIVTGLVELRPFGTAAPILVGGLILVLAALLRQFTLLNENQRLHVTVADIALRDPLTGLPNRSLFADRLAHAMQLRVRNTAAVSVLVLDLDDFKLVNDSLGHAAGDGLLRDVGDRIHLSLRTFDTVARLGGDEFAVLIEDDPETAYELAEQVVAAFDEPFEVNGSEVFVRPSVGLAVATSAGDVDVSADDLFRRADLAMYSAKRAQFHGVRRYTSDMRLDATQMQLSHRTRPGPRAGVARIQLLGDLRHAIDERQLVLVYQPKVSLASGAVVGVEALIRWPHPELGTLEPADFLPLVRQNGLMDAVTDFVVSQAVEDAASWHAAGMHVPVAINLPAPSLNDGALPERIQAILTEHGLPSGSLSVEITEDALLADVPRARTVLDRLRHNGIRVSIDDFGTGYATMTYLQELRVDEIKLDRQFVAPIVRDPRAAAIVESVIELATTFGIACVAEGVEDEATAERLREYGCGYAQGFYFSPPVAPQSVTSLSALEATAGRPSSA